MSGDQWAVVPDHGSAPELDKERVEAASEKAVFQSGISWRVIEAKWDGFRTAFEGFDPRKIAAFTPADADRLAEDARIVRNRRKIEATIDNAVEVLALDEEFNGFRFIGDTGAYYFLYVVGEKVPSHEEFMRCRA